jgi:hypothetical protein
MTVGAAVAAIERSDLGFKGSHSYEFGIYQGRSMDILSKVLAKDTFMWGLDSFEGLPATSTDQPGWQMGGYSSDPRALLRKSVGKNRVGFVKGFYNESLTGTLKESRGMQTARYIGIDCDLYESTVVALDWAFKSGVVAPGTLIGYDDWWVLPCSGKSTHPLSSGEGLAHLEISQKYDVEFVCIGGPCHKQALVSQQKGHNGACSLFGTWGPLFMVASIGSGRQNTGFEMSSDEVAEFMKANGMCAMHHTLFGGESNGQVANAGSTSAAKAKGSLRRRPRANGHS